MRWRGIRTSAQVDRESVTSISAHPSEVPAGVTKLTRGGGSLPDHKEQSNNLPLSLAKGGTPRLDR